MNFLTTQILSNKLQVAKLIFFNCCELEGFLGVIIKGAASIQINTNEQYYID